jgi:hypothetical protein
MYAAPYTFMKNGDLSRVFCYDILHFADCSVLLLHITVPTRGNTLGGRG